jgi:NAD dependent epimerase/dehydratase
MERVFVTGAGGFIGSHLVEALAASGLHTTALVHYNSLNSWGWLEQLSEQARKSVKVVAGDIRDGAGLKRAMGGCDTVLHLAALISIPFSYDHPQSYIDTNVSGTLNVLQAALELGVKRVVVTSTSEVYGSAQTVPITEDHPLHPQSPYAASKVGADQLALSFQRSFDLPVVVMRPFNTFGPRQSARAIIPTIISQLLSGAKKISLGALEPTRDFIYVEDTAQAFIAAAQSDKAVGQVMQAGSGAEISIGDLAKLIIEVCDKKAEIEIDQQRLRPSQSEVTRLWASNDRITTLTKWKPQFGLRDGMRRGLEKTVEWFKNPENLRRYKPNVYNI